MRRTRAGGADERDGQAAVGGIAGPVQVGVAPVPPPRQLPVVRMDQEPVAGPVARARVAEPEPEPLPSRSGAFEWAKRLGLLGRKATEKRVPDLAIDW